MDITTGWRRKRLVLVGGLICMSVAASALCAGAENPPVAGESPWTATKSEIVQLKQQLSEQQKQLSDQQKQIEELRLVLQELRKSAAGDLAGAEVKPQPAAAPSASTGTHVLGEIASAAPMVPAKSETQSAAIPPSMIAAASQTTASENVEKQLEALSRGLAGFHFSGDFRFRLDMQLRSSNGVAGPLQNVRSRYRLRFNVDKDIDKYFNFHMQLSTGPYQTQTTNDQDMAGMAAKAPFSVAEAFVDFHPSSRISMRGGRMDEVFADNMRYLWDDDVRFNGFQQIAKIPLGSGVLGFTRLELRSGEYILSNPGVYVLAASSPYVTAGYQPGQKVRAAQLFHPGFQLQGDLGSRWSQQFTSDVQLYRNQNQIALSSTAPGYPVVVSPPIGVTIPAPIPTVGNATTTPGGAIYSAGNFQIVRLAYRLERKGILIAGREMPAWFDFQVSRNVGTGRLRDGLAASANLGSIHRFGDMRFLYQFVIKDANSLISQFTDDDLGTGLQVNVQVHALRFDFGLTRHLQWQNLLFIQKEISGNGPNFFVPVPRGAATLYRYLGQLAFSF